LDFAVRTFNKGRTLVMSVEQPDVIDFVARDPKTDDTLLVMVEVRDWNSSPIAIQQLETKLALYSEFIQQACIGMRDIISTLRNSHNSRVRSDLLVNRKLDSQ